MQSTFVQLTKEDCAYLLNLIDEMDSETRYTEKQRGYTIPKLQKIASNPESGRLHQRDVDYLIELIEDDDLPEYEQQREMTRATLAEIQSLMEERASLYENINQQRAFRKARRNPGPALQEHFQPTA